MNGPGLFAAHILLLSSHPALMGIYARFVRHRNFALISELVFFLNALFVLKAEGFWSGDIAANLPILLHVSFALIFIFLGDIVYKAILSGTAGGQENTPLTFVEMAMNLWRALGPHVLGVLGHIVGCLQVIHDYFAGEDDTPIEDRGLAGENDTEVLDHTNLSSALPSSESRGTVDSDEA